VLYENHDDPSKGLLFTTLKDKQGLRLQPFDFGTSFAVTNISVIDKSTIYDTQQKILVTQSGRCVYTVGTYVYNSAQQPQVMLSQWYIPSLTAVPGLIDQVTCSSFLSISLRHYHD
jgi:hypothetical protein